MVDAYNAGPAGAFGANAGGAGALGHGFLQSSGAPPPKKAPPTLTDVVQMLAGLGQKMTDGFATASDERQNLEKSMKDGLDKVNSRLDEHDAAIKDLQSKIASGQAGARTSSAFGYTVKEKEEIEKA